MNWMYGTFSILGPQYLFLQLFFLGLFADTNVKAKRAGITNAVLFILSTSQNVVPNSSIGE
jgi:hypothetical protein